MHVSFTYENKSLVKHAFSFLPILTKAKSWGSLRHKSETGGSLGLAN